MSTVEAPAKYRVSTHTPTATLEDELNQITRDGWVLKHLTASDSGAGLRGLPVDLIAIWERDAPVVELR